MRALFMQTPVSLWGNETFMKQLISKFRQAFGHRRDEINGLILLLVFPSSFISSPGALPDPVDGLKKGNHPSLIPARSPS